MVACQAVGHASRHASNGGAVLESVQHQRVPHHGVQGDIDMLIRTRPGAIITDIDSMTIATLQASVITHAICHRDEDDFTFEFKYHDHHWIVGAENVELINHMEVLLCLD